METSANLHMEHPSLSATQTNRCHIKPDLVMHSVEKVTVDTDLDAISCIRTKILKHKLSHCPNLGRFCMKAEKKMEADY